MKNGTPWTEKEYDTVRSLWKAGLSASKIGARLGRSKNSVISCKRRLEDLEKRPSPIAVQVEIDNAVLAHRAAGMSATQIAEKMGVQRCAVVQRLGRMRGRGVEVPASSFSKPIAAGVNTLPPLPSIRVRAAPPPPPRPVYVPPPTACCFPLGEPKKPGFRFCDEPSVPGKPYCLDHARIAYVRVFSHQQENQQ